MAARRRGRPAKKPAKKRASKRASTSVAAKVKELKSKLVKINTLSKTK